MLAYDSICDLRGKFFIILKIHWKLSVQDDAVDNVDNSGD